MSVPNAVFAKPEVYEYLEERRVLYAMRHRACSLKSSLAFYLTWYSASPF